MASSDDELVLEVISLLQFFTLLLERPQTRKVYIRTLLSDTSIMLGPSIQLTHLIIESTNVEDHGLLLLIFNSAPILEKLCVSSDWIIQNLFSEIRWPRLRRIENPHGSSSLNLTHFEARQFPRLLYWIQGKRPFTPRIIEGTRHAIAPYNEHIFWILQKNWAKWRAARTLWAIAYLRLKIPREIAWMLADWVLETNFSDSFRGNLRPEKDLEFCITQPQIARWNELHLQETIISRTLAEEQYARAKNLTSNRFIARAEERINMTRLSIMKRRRCIEEREHHIARLTEERERAERKRKAIGAQGTLLGWLEGSEVKQNENTN